MKIIATDISNLTDARYFAAWGVYMMCYNVDPDTEGNLSVAQYQEIVDWVEGPATSIKIEGLSVPDYLTNDEIILENVLIGPFIEKSQLPKSITNIYRICTLEDGWQEDDKLILTITKPVAQLTVTEIDKIKNITATKEVYLDGVFKAADLENIEALGVEGIILKGGEEEKVGYKSFEELDEVLEAMY